MKTVLAIPTPINELKKYTIVSPILSAILVGVHNYYINVSAWIFIGQHPQLKQKFHHFAVVHKNNIISNGSEEERRLVHRGRKDVLQS